MVNKETQRNRNLINIVKDKHAEIMTIEQKIEWVTGIIKKKKAAGLTMEESRRQEEQKRTIIQNQVDRLSIQVKELEQEQQSAQKKQRAKYQDQLEEVSELKNDVKLLEIKIKEKD